MLSLLAPQFLEKALTSQCGRAVVSPAFQYVGAPPCKIHILHMCAYGIPDREGCAHTGNVEAGGNVGAGTSTRNTAGEPQSVQVEQLCRENPQAAFPCFMKCPAGRIGTNPIPAAVHGRVCALSQQ